MTTTKDLSAYLETLQDMADEGSEHYRAQLSAVLDQFDGDDSPEYRQLALLEWLNDQGNDYGPDDVSESTYDDCVFELCGRRQKYGTSPTESRKKAELVRSTLISLVNACDQGRLLLRWVPGAVDKAWLSVQDGELCYTMSTDKTQRLRSVHLRHIDKWRADWVTVTAGCIDMPDGYCWANYDNLKRFTSELLPDVLKIGLHDFLNSLYFLMGADKGTPHAEQLREAFDGETVKDRRQSHWTNNGEYLVCDDDEADDRWEQSLENYLDECVEGADGQYFDREAWKRDARTDGRGHSLSSYDGCESDHRGLCIFRTN